MSGGSENTIRIEFADSSSGSGMDTSRAGGLSTEVIQQALDSLGSMITKLTENISKSTSDITSKSQLVQQKMMATAEGHKGAKSVVDARTHGQLAIGAQKAEEMKAKNLSRQDEIRKLTKRDKLEHTHTMEKLNLQAFNTEKLKEKDLKNRKATIDAETQAAIKTINARTSAAKDLEKIRNAGHAERLKAAATQKEADRKAGMRNSFLASTVLGVGALGALVNSLGQKIGGANASYSTANSLIRPDIAYSQLFNSRLSAGTSATSMGLMGGLGTLGALLGSGIPGVGTLVGGAIGYGAGSLLSAGMNLIVPNVGAGQSIQNSGQYFSQVANTGYGSRFSGFTPSMGTAAAVMPGGQDTDSIMKQFSGAGSGSASLQAFISGQQGFIQATGSQSQSAAVVVGLSAVMKQLGIGSNNPKQAAVFDKLTNAAVANGGDSVQYLKTIVDIMQKGSSGNNLNQAMGMAFNSGLLSPALQEASSNYAQQGTLSQWTQGIMASATVGHGFNLASAYGANGKGAQLRALGILRKYDPAPSIMGGMPMNPAAEAILGSSANIMRDANPANAGLYNAPSATQSNAYKQYFSATTAMGKLAGVGDLQGIAPAAATQQMTAAQNAVGDYQMTANVINLSGNITLKNLANTNLPGAGSVGASFMQLIHGDKS